MLPKDSPITNSLKIIHSYPTWLPQTQTWMYNQVAELQRLGVDTHVVCERTLNLKQFTVANIHSLENEPFYKRLWDKRIRKLKLRHHMGYLVKISKKTQAQIIHSHFGHIGWANLGAVRKLGIKHVVTFYGFDVTRLPIKDPVWRDRYYQLFDEIDLVLCEGSHMARCVAELGCPDQKINVQHLGVDVDNIHFQPRQWHTNEPLRVLLAASFREKKGLTYAIDALSHITPNVQVHLTIIGDAGVELESQQEKKRILTALDRSGLREHTKLLGYQPHQTMLQEAYDHHLFLQPSVTAKNGDTEGGAPVSIIEMLATGMPVIATTHCDIPEVVGPAFAHLLAPERNAAKLAECIQSLLESPNCWVSLAQKGRKHIECEYHRVQQAKHLTNHYNSMLEKK